MRSRIGKARIKSDGLLKVRIYRLKIKKEKNGGEIGVPPPCMQKHRLNQQ
jgi:hypothetical protein